MNDLILGVLRAEDDLAYYREKYQLEGERIFEDIDIQRVGYFYSTKFAQWVNHNCAFTLTDEDLGFV